MKLVQNLLGDWQRLTCSHHWVRARWADGSYGLRCADCMKPYRHTWDEIIASDPLSAGASRLQAVSASPVAVSNGLRRAA